MGGLFRYVLEKVAANMRLRQKELAAEEKLELDAPAPEPKPQDQVAPPPPQPKPQPRQQRRLWAGMEPPSPQTRTGDGEE